MKTLRFITGLALLLLSQRVVAQPSIVTYLTNGMYQPSGVAVDSNKNIYVSDSTHRILKYSAANGVMSVWAGMLLTNASRTPLIDNGPGFFASFYAPRGLAIYGGGLVVADSGHHVLRYVSITGKVSVVTTFAGFTNQPGLASATVVPAASASAFFNSPVGLAVSGTNLFVADAKNNAIRRVYPDALGVYQLETVTGPNSGLFEPTDLAVGDNGELYVADTRNNCIKVLRPQSDGSYSVSLLAGSAGGAAGARDSYFADGALFNTPSGLSWRGDQMGLLVADSGNHCLRRVYLNEDLTQFFGTNIYSVELYAGISGQAGLVDGALTAARFKSPLQMISDSDRSFLIVDSGNNAIRRFQKSPPQPPLVNPVLATFTLVTNVTVMGTKITTVKDTIRTDNMIFDNLQTIVLENTNGSSTVVYYTFGETPQDRPDNIPLPPGPPPRHEAARYSDGMSFEKAPKLSDSVITESDIRPDMTIKAVVVDSGNERLPSAVVTNRVRFKVADPIVVGDNPYALQILDNTKDAEIWYTIDDIGSADPIPRTNTYGPYASGQYLPSLSITGKVILRVQAFRNNWQSSMVVSKEISSSDFAANRITFGFASGEASSAGVASAGQRYFAPITLSLLENQSFYSMQFGLTVTSLWNDVVDPGTGSTNSRLAPWVDASALNFQTTLMEKFEREGMIMYRPIKPQMSVSLQTPDILVPVQTEVVFWTNKVVQTNETIEIPVRTNITFITNYFDVGYVTNIINSTNNIPGTPVVISVTTNQVVNVIVSTNVSYALVTNPITAVVWYQATNVNTTFRPATNLLDFLDRTNQNLLAWNTNNWVFSVGDIVLDTNETLIKRLNAQADPISQFLWGEFSPEARDILMDTNLIVAVDNYGRTNITAKYSILQKRWVLAWLFNDAIYGFSNGMYVRDVSGLYDTDRFLGVTLSSDTTSLLGQPPADTSSWIRLNRMLLEDAYPEGLMRNRFNMLMVGWMERPQFTNLYNTKLQHLIQYSMPHNHLFESLGRKVVTGAFSFLVPTNADGSSYSIRIWRPSATSDGIDTDTYIDAPANGPITAIKTITVAQRRYLVGDTVPFRWFNAGDFGDYSLMSSDLSDLFQYVAYGFNTPLEGSDFRNAMDSADNPGVGVAEDGSEAYYINNMGLGDGQLDVSDIYTTFRRALDPTLTWWERYWEGGQLKAGRVANNFRGRQDLRPVKKAAFHAASVPAETNPIRLSSARPSIRFIARDMLEAGAGETVTVPIEAQIAGRYPLRVLLMNLDVTPVDGAPPLTDAVRFTPVDGLGASDMSQSAGPGNYSAAWLDSSVAGVWGTNLVGYLQVPIPKNAPATASYRVGFAKISASSSGIGTFPATAQSGVLSLRDARKSSLGDGIPDVWRIRYFGTVSNVLSAATADADGDGVSNWAEYNAGTDPNDVNSALRLQSRTVQSAQDGSMSVAVVVRWPSIASVRYVIEASPSLTDPKWTPLSAELTGTGQDMEYADTGASTGPAKYYRVRVVNNYY